MTYYSPADIAEMKSRGFDRDTIAKAEQETFRWQAGQEICAAIRSAFDGVTLGEGIGLRQAQGIDDYEDEATCAAYRARDEKDDWRRITTEELCGCNSSLSFFDAEGMRFHLPAYLIADLEGEYGYGMVFTLTYNRDSSWDKYALLSPEQRRVVRQYLLFALEDPDNSHERSVIEHALKYYWSDEIENTEVAV